MKPILDPKRDLVLEMSTLLCKPLFKRVGVEAASHPVLADVQAG